MFTLYNVQSSLDGWQVSDWKQTLLGYGWAGRGTCQKKGENLRRSNAKDNVLVIKSF